MLSLLNISPKHVERIIDLDFLLGSQTIDSMCKQWLGEPRIQPDTAGTDAKHLLDIFKAYNASQ